MRGTQGSILGPLLFIVYINDIINCCKAAIFIMLADDTNVIFKHKNLKKNYVNILILNYKKYLLGLFILNKLSLNIRKKHIILSSQLTHNS